MRGPYFFEESGITVTVTSKCYCELLENFLRSKVKLGVYSSIDHDLEVWFHQGGATPHTTRTLFFNICHPAEPFFEINFLWNLSFSSTPRFDFRGSVVVLDIPFI